MAEGHDRGPADRSLVKRVIGLVSGCCEPPFCLKQKDAGRDCRLTSFFSDDIIIADAGTECKLKNR